MIESYIMKPKVMRVIQWTGDNLQELLDFTAPALPYMKIPTIVPIAGSTAVEVNTVTGKWVCEIGGYILCETDGHTFGTLSQDSFESQYVKYKES